MLRLTVFRKFDHAEVDADGANLATILRPVGAEVQELNHALKVVAGRRRREPGDILNFRRQDVVRRSGNQRPAIRHKELQEEHDRAAQGRWRQSSGHRRHG